MRIAVIGCGVMGGAIARSWAGAHSLVFYDTNSQKAAHMAAELKGESVNSIAKALERAEVVLLAIKPKDLSKFALEASSFAVKGQIWISILAGTPLHVLKSHLSLPNMIRVMPNLALLYREGVIGLVEDPLHQHEDKEIIEGLLKELGLLIWLPESKIDALTALASSGPAFILVILEAFIEGGVTMGLTAENSKELAIKTFEGAIALLEHSKKSPAELKLQIASPGGMTIVGLNALEASGVRAGVTRALLSAHKRAIEMNEEHK